MWVISMRIWGVVMMVVMVIVVMVIVMMMHRLQPAHTGAKRVAKGTVCDIRTRRVGPLAFNMMVVAFLDRANFGLKPKNLNPVFAQNACWRRHCPKGRMFTIFDADMMMTAVFQSQHLFALSAAPAIRGRAVAILLQNAISKGFKHFGMITQISGFHELNSRMLGGDLVCKAIDPINQDA